MLSFLRWAAVFIASLLGGFILAFPVFVTSLIVNELVSTPLALVVGGLACALSACWAGNIGARDRSNLGRTIATAELVAAFLALVYFMLALAGTSVNVLPFFLLLGTVAIVALASTLAARKFRSPRPGLRRDVALTAGLLVGSYAVVIAAILIASLFGLTGA